MNDKMEELVDLMHGTVTDDSDDQTVERHNYIRSALRRWYNDNALRDGWFVTEGRARMFSILLEQEIKDNVMTENFHLGD